MIIKNFYRDKDKKVCLCAFILEHYKPRSPIINKNLGCGHGKAKPTLDNESKNGFSDKRKSVLILPGGGYLCHAEREAEPVALAFLSEGMNAFILYYSVNEHSSFPQPLEDAEWAMNMISEHFQIDEKRIAVCGFSAGGHLAAALGTMGKIRPHALILGYPCIIMDKHSSKKYPSLEKAADEKTPACFIFTTRDDDCVKVTNTLEFAKALEEKQIPFELHIFACGDHGLSLAKKHLSKGEARLVNEPFSVWFNMCIDWLESVP